VVVVTSVAAVAVVVVAVVVAVDPTECTELVGIGEFASSKEPSSFDTYWWDWTVVAVANNIAVLAVICSSFDCHYCH